MSTKGTTTFKDWCEQNGHYDLLDMWDENITGFKPDEKAYKSNKEATFHCGNPKHPRITRKISTVTSPQRTGLTRDRFCIGCHSVGQYFIDNYGEEYLYKIWSDKNELDPFEVAAFSAAKTIWLRCLNNPDHPDYDLHPCAIINAFGCPYCKGRRVCDSNSVVVQHPEIYEYWSDKNNNSPDKYILGSHENVWVKCNHGVHSDYLKEIRLLIQDNFECPLCTDHMLPSSRGAAMHITERYNVEYCKWRESVMQRDNYTCQCCHKRGGSLNVHHIYNYANNPELRLDVNNGITLCNDCHRSSVKGSFHNIYGTMNNTPEQLEEYINNKRNILGIDELFSVKEYIDLIDNDKLKAC